MARRSDHRWWALGVPLALAMPGAMLPAQPGAATIAGRVVRKASTVAVARAEIVLLADGRHVVADSLGLFVFADIPPGPQRFLVRALGFRPAELSVTLPEGAVVRETIDLEVLSPREMPQPLDPVAVDAHAPSGSYRLADFERRRSTGRGQYRTDEEITQSGAARLQDLMRGMRGVTLRCAGHGCRIQMVRAREGCEPDYVVDGRTDNMFGSVTPIRDIIALEVYTGPSDVPGEFAGRTAGCGVVVIWTRAGPPRGNPR